MAALLARRGCRVMILDRATFPRPKPCGDYLNPGCSPVLARLGVQEDVAAQAHPVRGMSVVAPDGTIVAAPFAPAVGWALQRRTLDGLLLAHAARSGARVVEGARVVGLIRERDRIRVDVDRQRATGDSRCGPGRETFTASLVVGADGLRSTVARAVGAGEPLREGRYTVGTYIEGLAVLDPRVGDGFGEIHLLPNCYCGVAYLPGGLANVTIALGRRSLRAWRGALATHYWTSLRAFPGLAGRLAGARQVRGFVTSGPLAFARRRAVADGVVLTGDAAGFIDPMTGQGVYLALRGAELAAGVALRALEEGRTSARALAGYDRARRREFGRVFLLSRILQALAFRPTAIRQATHRMAARSDLAAGLMHAVANVEDPGSVLRPWFFARIMGLG